MKKQESLRQLHCQNRVKSSISGKPPELKIEEPQIGQDEKILRILQCYEKNYAILDLDFLDLNQKTQNIPVKISKTFFQIISRTLIYRNNFIKSSVQKYIYIQKQRQKQLEQQQNIIDQRESFQKKQNGQSLKIIQTLKSQQLQRSQSSNNILKSQIHQQQLIQTQKQPINRFLRVKQKSEIIDEPENCLKSLKLFQEDTTNTQKQIKVKNQVFNFDKTETYNSFLNQNQQKKQNLSDKVKQQINTKIMFQKFKRQFNQQQQFQNFN